MVVEMKRKQPIEEHGKMVSTETILTDNENKALKKIKANVLGLFNVRRFVLFGSAARGETDEESDIDLLLVTNRPLNRWERHQITDVVCEINLEYGTNFSTLVVDSRTWDSGPISYLNTHKEIQKEGIPV
jgi:predicted nucleotidyltransferase